MARSAKRRSTKGRIHDCNRIKPSAAATLRTGLGPYTRVRIDCPPPPSPACRDSRSKVSLLVRRRAFFAVKVHQRSAPSAKIWAIGRPFLFFVEGRWTLATHVMRGFPLEAGSAPAHPIHGSAGLLLGQARASKPRSFLCAFQLRGRSPGRVESACAVSSGGCWPWAICSMIAGARKANRTIRLT
jgi:hypothetical protein